MGDRPLRLCDVCRGYDNHPRHVQALHPDATDGIPTADTIAALPDGVSGTAMAQYLQPNVVVRHMDCCAAQGCPTCAETEAFTGGMRGWELIETLDVWRDIRAALDGPEV